MLKQSRAVLEKLSELQFVIVLVIIGLLVGIVAIKSNGVYSIAPDSVGYHNYAVNILERGVYSVQYDPPYLENFIREPGYPLFLALVYKSISLFAKPTLISKGQYDSVNRQLTTYKPEIEYAKYFHLLLLIIAVYFFYLSIRMFSSLLVSRLTGFTVLLYYPYTMYCVYLLREALVGFFLALFSYCLIRFYKSNNQWSLLLATATIGLAALTWQVMIAFTPLIMITMLVSKCPNRKTIMWTCLYACVFISIMSPWLFYVYAYYPDIRIIKSGGTSLTHEVMGYGSVLIEAEHHGTLTPEEFSLRAKEIYRTSSGEVFRMSFSGWYKNAGDSLMASMNVSNTDHFKYRIISYVTKFKHLLIQNRWQPFIHSQRWAGYLSPIIRVFFNGISLCVGVLSLMGIFLLARKQLIMLLPYIMFGALFIVIGSESRRFLVILPFMVYLNILAFRWTRARMINAKEHRLHNNSLHERV